ncbi:hypothetical protein EOI86_23075 [Hwanghaeella grinnelliae]|uniref:Flippase-like domain-containing protein n=1 Tax=Hwanghaeella grinnelliae TaxID=2500179 RepID=A0A437QHH0_9PROT|nr:lysylphosphatidylglycerol synthase transmembrane domain-containing protein [Hwanghaeella grinnelliae]RVU34007.1 hypothetical protein EOI86_23075 [Hwanghaeella grinnelliae]
MTAELAPIKHPFKRWAKFLLPIVISTGILVYLFYNYRIEAIWEKVDELSIFTVLVALGLLLGNLALGIGRLKYLLSYFGARDISTFACIRAFVAGLLSSIFILNLVGNVVGRFALLRRQGVSVATVTALVFTEKLLLAISGLALLVFGWVEVFGSRQLYTALAEASLPEAVLAMCLVTAASLAIFRWTREQQLLRRMVSRTALSRIGAMLALTLAAQILMALTYAIIAERIIGPSAPSLTTLFAAGAIVSFAAAMPLSVNGWGIRELTSIFVLGKLGVPAPEAVGTSVTLGVLATVSVLISSVFLAKPLATSALPAKSAEDSKDQESVLTVAKVQSRTTNSIVLLVAGPLTVLFLFFSMHIPFEGTVVSLNLGDPMALMGLALFLLTWTTSKKLPAEVPRFFLYWMLALTLLLIGGFLNGAARIGVTDWALNNRLIGWSVILGYVSIGAMCVSTLGLHSLRRLAEVIIVGGAMITLFDLAHRQFEIASGSFEFIASNFEGFVKNRNAFALQLLTGLVALLAYSVPFKKKLPPILLSFLLGSIMLGIWRSYSLSGLACMVILLAIALLLRLLPWKMFGLAVFWAGTVIGLVSIFSYISNVSGVDRLPFNHTPDADLIVGGSTSERLLTIRVGLEMWMANPIFGEGLGSFANRHFGENGKQLVIHSVPIWLLAEFGLVGLAIALSLPLAVAFKYIRSYTPNRAPAFMLTLGLLLLFAMFGLVHDIAYQRLFWLLAGACAAASVKVGYSDKQR